MAEKDKIVNLEDLKYVNDKIGDLKSAYHNEILYEDTSVNALAWRKNYVVSSLGRYSNNHPEGVALFAGPDCPYVYAGTTFTAGSGYIISMAIWSVPVTSTASTDNRLYLAYNVGAGTVTAPVDGYLALSVANGDDASVSADAATFAAGAITSCTIYKRTLKTELSGFAGRIDNLYAETNDQSIWLSGKWNVANGNPGDDSKLIKTKKYIPTDYLKDALGIVAASGYEFSVLCWQTDGTYKGSWTGSGFSTSANTFFTNLTLSDIGSGYKYAINVRKTNGDDITVSACTNISFIVPTCYKKVDIDQGLASAGKTLIVGDDGKTAPVRQQIDRHTDLFAAQKEIATDWHLPFINVADELMLGANHQIPGTATTWSESGATDLTQKNVWMSDGTHPYRGVGLVDMFGRAIANQMAMITPSYHDGSGQSSPSYWAGKSLLWMGTSIPAGSDPEAGDGDGATYPALVATQLGATTINIARGSSMMRVKSSTGLYDGIPLSHFLRSLTRMNSEATDLAENWDDIKSNFGSSVPSSLYDYVPDGHGGYEDYTYHDIMQRNSFENLLLPYLDGTNTAPDAIVIDHGHNDIANGIDGNKDFWVHPSQESIASGLLAEDTWMTANNYANLKLALDDDLSGITDLPAFAASLNRNCFIGAANFLITLILRHKPYMRIIFVSDYN